VRKAFALRISKDLWDEIQRLASADLRSVNAEIEYLLRDAAARRRGRRREERDSRA
jgi:hypothetical protein